MKESWQLAKVLEVNGDLVKVKMLREELFLEAELEKELGLELPYGTASVRGFDFLPEVDSIVFIHLSRTDPSLAYLAQSMPTNQIDEKTLAHQSDTSLDPAVHFIRLENKNGVTLSEDAIAIDVQKKSVKLQEEDGVSIACDLPVKLLSGADKISLKAKKIELKADGELLLSGGMSSMIIGDAVDLKSTLIKAN